MTNDLFNQVEALIRDPQIRDKRAYASGYLALLEKTEPTRSEADQARATELAAALKTALEPAPVYPGLTTWNGF